MQRILGVVTALLLLAPAAPAAGGTANAPAAGGTANASAAGGTAPAADARAGVPNGLSFEAFPNPELGQAFLFVRFAEARSGDARVAIQDVSGDAVVTLSAPLESGSAMLWWDGVHDDGSAPGGDYTAVLTVDGAAPTASLAAPRTASFPLPGTPNEAPHME